MTPKNYITRNGYQKLQDELQNLLNTDRPEYVNLVSWAASNGDRSENADYQYGKKKLREIDRRIYALTKSLESAEVVDSSLHSGSYRVYFGATVIILKNSIIEHTVSIVGVDEINDSSESISWISPLGMALLGKNVGDKFEYDVQGRYIEVEVISVTYA